MPVSYLLFGTCWLWLVGVMFMVECQGYIARLWLERIKWVDITVSIYVREEPTGNLGRRDGTKQRAHLIVLL